MSLAHVAAIAEYIIAIVAVCLSVHQGGSKKVSCWHSTTAYFFEPPCMCVHIRPAIIEKNSNRVILGTESLQPKQTAQKTSV